MKILTILKNSILWIIVIILVAIGLLSKNKITTILFFLPALLICPPILHLLKKFGSQIPKLYLIPSFIILLITAFISLPADSGFQVQNIVAVIKEMIPQKVEESDEVLKTAPEEVENNSEVPQVTSEPDTEITSPDNAGTVEDNTDNAAVIDNIDTNAAVIDNTDTNADTDTNTDTNTDI